jgi:hypothetical protein
MRSVGCWMRDGLFGAALIVTGYILVSQTMAPQQVRAEAAGCANNMCKEIKYYRNCTNGTSYAWQVKSCIVCTKFPGNLVDGRCDSGTTDACLPPGIRNFLALTDVTLVCDCQKLPGPGQGNVEATGNYTGSYDIDPVTGIFLCQKPS